MGNHKFKLSDMIPNAWFYKLKDMNKTRNPNPSKKKQSSKPSPTQPSFSSPRHSYYFTTDPLKAEKLYSSPLNPKFSDTHFPEPPRKSYKRSRTKKNTISSKSPSPKLVNTSVSNGGSFKSRLGTAWHEPDFTPELSESLFDSSPDSISYEFMLPDSEESDHVSDPFDSLTSWSSNCSCRISSSTADIIIDMDANGKDSFNKKFDNLDVFDSIPALELPPIVTKPAKFNDMVSEIRKKEAESAKFRSTAAKLEQRKRNEALSVKVVKEQKIITSSSSIRKSSMGSTTSGVKLRSNSPKIANKKIQACSRKSVSSTSSSLKSQKKNVNVGDSFAIIKSSFDPQGDFRESMVEMIVENNIRASKDLENLLACYLSLNSNEYHDLIIKVFEQIWFDLTNFQL